MLGLSNDFWRQAISGGGESSAAKFFAEGEYNIAVFDFTDNSFAASGHVGAVFIREASNAEIFSNNESYIAVFDFTDTTWLAETGHAGSVYIRTA